MEKKNITKIWTRFIKEYNIYHSVLNLIKDKHIINKCYIEDIMCRRHYDEYFQRTDTFYNWSDTTQGFNFWQEISTTWRAHLYSLGYDINKESLIEYLEDSSKDCLEELKLKYPSIKSLLNEQY